MVTFCLHGSPSYESWLLTLQENKGLRRRKKVITCDDSRTGLRWRNGAARVVGIQPSREMDCGARAGQTKSSHLLLRRRISDCLTGWRRSWKTPGWIQIPCGSEWWQWEAQRWIHKSSERQVWWGKQSVWGRISCPSPGPWF